MEENKLAKRQELLAKLQAKIGQVRVCRSSKHNKERILEQTLSKVGLDKDKLKADIKALKKQGGLTINIPT